MKTYTSAIEELPGPRTPIMDQNQNLPSRKGERIDSRINNDMRKIMYQAHYQERVDKVLLPPTHASWNNFVRPD